MTRPTFSPPPRTTFEPISKGRHLAVCFGLIDLGFQRSARYAPAHQIALLFITDEEGKDSWRKYTYSDDKKSNLYKTLESWFPEENTKRLIADLPNAVLQKPAELIFKHSPAKSSDRILAEYGLPLPVEPSAMERVGSIVVPEEALLIPNTPAEFRVRELSKFPTPLRHDFANQLSIEEYERIKGEFKARADAIKALGTENQYT